MTQTTPDISSLTIAEDYDAFHDQQHKTFHYSQSPSQQSLSPQFQFAPASLGPQNVKRPARAGLPTQWMDSNTDAAILDNRPISPPHTSDISSSGGSPPPPQVAPQIQQPQLYGSQTSPPAPASHHSGDDDVIPNAIVIKNIPFTVKRETLLDIIASLNIPTPYAFNYHIDTNGQFRGLAFANFRVAADADAVVAALNGFDVQGRKLRVEYKKVLLAGEKERIEREKAMRRMRSMQLEKEREAMNRMPNGQEWDTFGPIHSVPMPNMSPPHMGPEMSPIGGVSPLMNPLMPGMPAPAPRSYGQLGMPLGMGIGQPSMQQSIPQPYPSPPPMSAAPSKAAAAATELDLNDPATLEIYSRILVFKEDRMRDELAFSRSLTPKQRRVVHLVAQRLGVYHYSVGEGDERYAVVTRIPREDAPRQPVRHASQVFQRSPAAYLNPPASQNAPNSASANGSGTQSLTPNVGLRYKKSMPDLASLHTDGPRLQSRASNSNIREGYATMIGISPRRNKYEFNSLFGANQAAKMNGSDIPPVPILPTIPSINTDSGVVRQPRGPGTGGFARRPAGDLRSASHNAASQGLDTRTHEPLEI